MKKNLLVFLTFLCYSIVTNAQVSFNVSSTSGCRPLSVTFTNTTSGVPGATWYRWYIAGGNPYQNAVLQTTGLASTNYTFTKTGMYDIYLEARQNPIGSGAPIAWSNYTTINVEGISDSLYVCDKTICPGDITCVNVNYGYNTNITNINWNMGNGVTYNNVDYYGIAQQYNSLGNFQPTATVTTSNCGTYNVSGPIINVGSNHPIELSNLGLPQNDTICPNDEFNLYTSYFYPNYTVNWGDGNVNNNQYTHTYLTTGTYFPEITYTNGCGNSASLQSQVVVMNNRPISYVPGTIIDIFDNPSCPNAPVQFNYNYSVNFANYIWNLGPGQPMQQGSKVVNTTYQNTGTYPISLTLVNGCGSQYVINSALTISNNVPILNPTILGYFGGNVCPGDGIFLVGASDSQNDDALSYHWNFGDGNTANTRYASHSYSTTGAFTITLTITNICGNSATATQVINVTSNAIPNPADYFAIIAGESSPACVGDTIIYVFGPASTGGIVHWDFGDGNQAIANQIIVLQGMNYIITKHAYAANGNYNIVCTYTNSCGNSMQKNLTKTIGNAIPEASLFEDPSVFNCQGKPVAFYGYGGNTLIWNFGDGTGTLVTNSPLSPVNHTYQNAGTYTVTLTVINSCGNSHTSTEQVIVPPSKINITTNTVSSNCGQNNGKAIAIASGGSTPYQYYWSNGGQSFINNNVPSGIYVVTVTDKNGCDNFAIATVSDLEAPTIVANSIINVSCYGLNNGAIDINIIGNSAPYNYQWSNGSINQDVNNLAAGPHEVIVTDANGCLATRSYQINQPDEVIVSTISQNASCGGVPNGQAQAIVSGSTGPYSYVWSNGLTNSTATGLQAGIYTLVVVDANGCIYEKSVGISEGNLNIVLDSITGTGCLNSLANIYIKTLPLTNSYTYNWSNNTTNEDLLGVQIGTYTVAAIANNGCNAYREFKIENAAPVGEKICTVSVDSLTNTNLVVWEKDNITPDISHYRIYKESSQSGLYYWVANVDADSLARWVDPVSDPQVRSWRYRIAAVNDCGKESVVSSEHKTIHLNVNVGLNGAYNLIWDHYEGRPFSSYEIWRMTNTGWAQIATVPNNIFSFTDVNGVSSGAMYYRVDAVINDNCDPTRAGINTSRSNAKNTPAAPPFSVEDILLDPNAYSIYPNPATDELNVLLPNVNENFIISIYNSLGQLVQGIDLPVGSNGYKNISLSQFERGMYYVTFETKKSRVTKKLIKQ